MTTDILDIDAIEQSLRERVNSRIDSHERMRWETNSPVYAAALLAEVRRLRDADAIQSPGREILRAINELDGPILDPETAAAIRNHLIDLHAWIERGPPLTAAATLIVALGLSPTGRDSLEALADKAADEIGRLREENASIRGRLDLVTGDRDALVDQVNRLRLALGKAASELDIAADSLHVAVVCAGDVDFVIGDNCYDIAQDSRLAQLAATSARTALEAK